MKHITDIKDIVAGGDFYVRFKKDMIAPPGRITSIQKVTSIGNFVFKDGEVWCDVAHMFMFYDFVGPIPVITDHYFDQLLYR